MKKHITIEAGHSNFGILIPFFIYFLFSVNSHGQKILTTVSDAWKNGTWENSDRTSNTYDGNGYLIKDLTQIFDVTWQNLLQNNYSNNPDGTVQQSISEIWYATSNAWVPNVRATLTYNAAKKVLTSVSESYHDPSWVFSAKRIYTYDGNNYLSKIVSQNYDFISPWKDSSQIIYINNPDGTVSQSVSQLWTVNVWRDRERITYTYSNSKLTMKLTEKMNGVWENYSRETYDYDGSGYSILYQTWTEGAWKNDEQSFITNYANGPAFQIVSQFWNSNNIWDSTRRMTFNYVALGVDEQVFEKYLTVYPNPAQDKITIKTDNDHVGTKYLVTDQLGRQFLNGTITARETVLDVAQFSNGIYFIQVGQNKNETIKLVKQ